MKRRIVILGDSHTRSLVAAQHLVAESLPDIEFRIHWLASDKKGVVRGDISIEDSEALLESLGPGDIAAISILGTAHNVLGMLQHEVPFRVMRPGGRAAGEDVGGELIPWHVIRDTFVEMGARSKRIPKIRDGTKARVLHLMTPPPKESTEYMLEKIGLYRKKLASEVGVAAPEVRLGMWQAERDSLRIVCDQWRIGFLDAPADAMTADGYLRPEYYEDATHANKEYGELVLRQLAALPSGGVSPGAAGP